MSTVEIKFVGGNGQQKVNSILAKIVLHRLARERELKNESGNICKG